MKILVVTVLSVIIFVLYVWFLEETTVFIPSRDILATPKDAGLEYEDIYFNTQDDVKLNGWLVKTKGAKGTLIFLHGNAGNISDRLEKILLFSKLGINIFIIDYRGYGRSEGKPSEQGMYMDAKAAFDFLKSRDDIDTTRIMVYGASLGGAAAVDLAVHRKVSGIIIDSSFTSAADMAQVIFPFIPKFIIKTKLDSVNKIKRANVPKLFIHSRDDRTVPFQLGRKLYDAAEEPKQFLEITGDHNDGHIYSIDEYQSGIEEFLIKHGLK